MLPQWAREGMVDAVERIRSAQRQGERSPMMVDYWRKQVDAQMERLLTYVETFIEVKR